MYRDRLAGHADMFAVTESLRVQDIAVRTSKSLGARCRVLAHISYVPSIGSLHLSSFTTVVGAFRPEAKHDSMSRLYYERMLRI